MARAEYPLEMILRQRRREREEIQRELAEAQQRLAEVDLQLEHLRGEEAKLNRRMQEAQSRPALDLEVIGRCLADTRSLGAIIAAQEQISAATARECEAIRDHLLATTQAVQVVEKLKESWLGGLRTEQLCQEERARAEAASFSRQVAIGW